MRRTWLNIGLVNLVLGIVISSVSLIGLKVGADSVSMEVASLASDGLNAFKVVLLSGITLSASSIFCFAMHSNHKK